MIAFPFLAGMVPKFLGDKSTFIYFSYVLTVGEDFLDHFGHLTTKFHGIVRTNRKRVWRCCQ